MRGLPPGDGDRRTARYAICLARDLSGAAKSVGVNLLSYINKETAQCNPSPCCQRTVLGIGKSATHNGLAQLRKAGLVDRGDYGGYQLHWTQLAERLATFEQRVDLWRSTRKRSTWDREAFLDHWTKGLCAWRGQQDRDEALSAIGVATDLSANEKMIAVAFVWFTHPKTGQCTPSIPMLSFTTGAHENVVRHCIRKLLKRGLLRKNAGGGSLSNAYHLDWDRLRQRAKSHEDARRTWVASKARRASAAQGLYPESQGGTPTKSRTLPVPDRGRRPCKITDSTPTKSRRQESLHGRAAAKAMQSTLARDVDDRPGSDSSLKRSTPGLEVYEDRILQKLAAGSDKRYGELIATLSPDLLAEAAVVERHSRGAGVAMVCEELERIQRQRISQELLQDDGATAAINGNAHRFVQSEPSKGEAEDPPVHDPAGPTSTCVQPDLFGFVQPTGLAPGGQTAHERNPRRR